MASFTVQRNFLQVALAQGQSVQARRGALIAMNDSVDMTAAVNGGLFQSFLRMWSTGDTFFRQQFVAVRGRGDLLLAPSCAGDIKVLDVGARQYGLNDGVFLAAESTLSLTARRRNLAKGIFGGGGFFVLETSGSGELAVNARGGIFEVEVKPGSDMLVDEKHLVAWELGLKQQFRLGSRHQSSLPGRLIGSQFSGEGVLSHFSGRGRLVLSSLGAKII
ncbi:TIGR00266 family protein [Prosthecobacter sp.]|uniref:TIGR00266 family protein n=1 Tax=Prosthecobacter sp. TaxID=1965333 RepID=UPI003782D741